LNDARWLTMLAEGSHLATEFVDSVRLDRQNVADLMTTAVISGDARTSVTELAAPPRRDGDVGRVSGRRVDIRPVPRLVFDDRRRFVFARTPRTMKRECGSMRTAETLWW